MSHEDYVALHARVWDAATSLESTALALSRVGVHDDTWYGDGIAGLASALKALTDQHKRLRGAA